MVKKRPDTSSAAPALSRRGFFTLAAALGISSSASFWEGFFVRAYADESDKTSYVIYVAKRWQVPVCFLDDSDPGNPNSVVGARVAITSLHNGNTVSAQTDQHGVAILDITSLAEERPESDASVRTDYSFYGSLTVEAAGFQTYSTGKLRIRGGEQVDAPTRPLDGKPYLMQATINGWDVLHSDAATFVATGNNPSADHKLVVKLADSSGEARVSAGHESSNTIFSKAASATSGIATVEISGKFFSTKPEDADEAFKLGEPIVLTVEPSDGESFGVETSASCEAGVSEAPITEATQGASDGLLTASSFLLESNQISPLPIPEGFPVFGSGSFNFESILPAFPLSYAFDPTGHIIAGVGYAGTLHKKGNAGGIWQHDTFQDAKDEYRRSKEEWTETFNRLKKNRDDARALGDKVSRSGKLSPLTNFEMNFQCGGMIHMEYGDYLEQQGSDDKFSGSAQLYAILGGEASYTLRFVVLYVPLFVRFWASASLRATIEVGVGVTNEKDGRFHLADGSSFSLNLKPELAVTVGVGVADLVSVGVRGSGYLNGYMGVNFQSVDGKPNPRLSLDGGAEVSVVIQAFMFKASASLYQIDGVLADNWATQQTKLLSSGAESTLDLCADLQAYSLGSRSGNSSSGFILRSGSPSSSFASTAVPVTNDELLLSAEFVAKAKPAVLKSGSNDSSQPNHDLFSYETIRRNPDKLMSGTPGLQSLGENGAVVVGETVSSDSYSDPRVKVIVVAGTPWMLRILSVRYDVDGESKVRTRLSIARWSCSSSSAEFSRGSWETPQVIDFTPVYDMNSGQNTAQTQPNRIDLFDYDFSALSADDVDGLGGSWKDGGVVRVFLTSGTRDSSVSNADDKSAFSHTVCSFLSINSDLEIVKAYSYLDTYASNPVSSLQGIGSLTAYRYSLITYPFVLSHGAGDNNVTVVFGFCRIAETPDKLLSGPYLEAPATAVFNHLGEPIVSPRAFTFASGGQNDSTLYSALFDDVKLSVVADIIEHNTVGQGTVTIGCHYVTEDGDSRVAKAFSLARRTSASTAGAIDTGDIRIHGGSSQSNFVYPWKSANGCSALSAVEGGLELRSINGEVKEANIAPISLDNDINLNSFALDPKSGMLYFATSRVGKERVRAEDGSPLEDKVDIADYRIWGTRCITVNGQTGFMKPFPLVQTSQPVDSLEYLDLGDSYGFIVNSIQSMESSTSNVMLYRLPYIKRVTMLDFEPVNRFVCAGEEEAFRITVRNDGNVSISAFSILLSVNGEDHQLDFNLTDTEKFIPLAGVWDAAPAAASSSSRSSGESTSSNSVVTGSSFDLATSAGILNPGVVRSYEFIWKVPENLSGQTKLTITVLENDAPSDNSQSSIVFGGENPRFANGALFASEATDGAIGASNIDANVQFRMPQYAEGNGSGMGNGNEPNPDIPPDNSGNGNGTLPSEPSDSGNGTEGGSSIPGEGSSLSNTGDSLSSTATAALLAGLGLAGMGVAASKLND